MKQNPKLAKEIIDIDNTPQKYLIINREEPKIQRELKIPKAQGKKLL